MLRRLGDGEDDKAQTLGGGPLGGDVFSTGPTGNLFLGQRSDRHRNQLLTAPASVVPESPSFLIDIGGDGGSSGAAGGADGGGGGGEGTE